MDIKRIAYEKHRLRWMLNHGKTISDLMCELTIMQQENPNDNVETLFDDWEFGFGFGGEIWPCYGEFLETEYQDEYYMRSLLNDAEWDVYAGERIPF